MEPERFPWWLDLAITLGGIAVAIASAAYTAGRKTAVLERTDADHARRLALIEEDRRQQDIACTRRKDEILAELRRDICNIVTVAIKDVIIDHQRELGIISTNVAVLTQCSEQTQKDVEAIFNRINRRSSDSGDRRRWEDVGM